MSTDALRAVQDAYNGLRNLCRTVDLPYGALCGIREALGHLYDAERFLIDTSEGDG